MTNPFVWWIVFSASIIIGLFGDVAMKQAGMGVTHWRWFAAGFTAYSATSFGWFLLLRTRSLSVFGTLYPVVNALGLVLLGILVFGERLGLRASAGLVTGVVSLILLAGGER